MIAMKCSNTVISVNSVCLPELRRLDLRKPQRRRCQIAALALLSVLWLPTVVWGLSLEKEIEKGREEHQKIVAQFGIYRDERLQAYVEKVGQRLAEYSSRPELEYRFTLLNDDMINAFALPGGYVYITRGMLLHLGSEAELAAVLGHEIAHITEKHGIKRESRNKVQNALSMGAAMLTGQRGVAELGQLLGGVLITGYSREFELEADEVGAAYMAQAGYSPKAMLKTIDILKNKDRVEIKQAKAEQRPARVYHGFLSSHPDNDTRYREAVIASDALLNDFDAFIRTDEFLQQLNGLSFGPSRQTGIVRGKRFYHAKLGLTLALPPGWRQNQVPRGVQFVSQTGEAAFELSTSRVKRDVSPEDFAKSVLGYQIREGRSLTIDGMPAYIAIADRAPSMFGVRPVRLIVAIDRRRGIAFVGQGSGQFDLKKIADDADFIRIGFSIAKMSRADFAKARPLKVQIVRAERDTTMAGLAELSDLTNYAEDQLRVINGLYPNGEPEPGQLIKIID